MWTSREGFIGVDAFGLHIHDGLKGHRELDLWADAAKLTALAIMRGKETFSSLRRACHRTVRRRMHHVQGARMFLFLHDRVPYLRSIPGVTIVCPQTGAMSLA